MFPLLSQSRFAFREVETTVVALDMRPFTNVLVPQDANSEYLRQLSNSAQTAVRPRTIITRAHFMRLDERRDIARQGFCVRVLHAVPLLTFSK